MILADQTFPHVNECLLIQSRAKPPVKNIVTTHPQAAVRLCLCSFIQKGCRPVTPKTPQAQINNTYKQTLLTRLSSNRAECERIKKTKNTSVNQYCWREEEKKKTSDRRGTRPADVYLTSGSRLGEHFSWHQGAWEGHF